MKTRLACALVLTFIVPPDRKAHPPGMRSEPIAVEAAPPLPSGARQDLAEAYGRIPLHFEANRGQTDPEVRFLSRGSGYGLFLTSTEAVFTLRGARTTGIESGPPAVVKIGLVDANPSPAVVGRKELPGKANYFLGKDPARWRRDVSLYEQVEYTGVYPGVDLVYYGNQRQLEFDFVVAPGANPSQIKLVFAGATGLRLDGQGNLVIQTPDGELVQHVPVAYQQANGVRRPVSAEYVVSADDEVAFEVDAYNPRLPLVIDPVLVYSVDIGGSAGEVGYAISVDAAGNAYVTGETTSTDFPTVNPLQPAHGGISLEYGWDAFVTKLNASGTAFVYSTYLGGVSTDKGLGVAADSAGNAYVTGYTRSWNFPVVNSTPRGSGGFTEIFVTKLNPSGSAMLYSTWYGGGNFDDGHAIAVDAAGSAYVAGATVSSDFPTVNPLQSTRRVQEAVVLKVNPSGSTLVYSTYLGGSGNDLGEGIAVDAAGNAYVTGSTASADFPLANAIQAANAGGNDAFVATINPSGSALVYSTYLGGAASDSGKAIAVDASGAAYVAGSTASANLPLAGQPSQPTFGGGTDAFVAKLSATPALVYSTYLGGSGTDVGNGIALDSHRNAYVTGSTTSSNFPLAGNPLQVPTSRGFVTKLGPTSALVYSTCIGAVGEAVAVDAAGNAYVTGPIFTGMPISGTDAFVMKLRSTVEVAVSPGDGPRGTTFTYSGANFTPSFGATSHLRAVGAPEAPTIQIPTNSSGAFSRTIDSTAMTPGTYEAWAVDNSTGLVSNRVSFSVSAATACLLTCTATASSGGLGAPTTFTASATPTNCSGTPSFTWLFGDGAGGTGRTTSHTYTTSGQYEWSMTAFVGAVSCGPKRGPIDISSPVAAFTFAPIASPQSGSTPFAVAISARDLAGNPASYAGRVAVTSPLPVSPAQVDMVGGQWQGAVSVLGCATDVTLAASGVGASGTSNAFDVTGGGCLGDVAGWVTDNRSSKLSGALVTLRPKGGGSVIASATTRADGSFTLRGTAAGQYEIQAESAGVASATRLVTVSSAATTALTISIPLNSDGSHVPLVLVPGIMGSTQAWLGLYILPDPGAAYPADRSSLRLWDGGDLDAARAGWEQLKVQLEAVGYQRQDTIFDCPWDWRMDVREAVGSYLLPCIDEVKRKKNVAQVDVVAHSMGGLLVRAYVEDLGYLTDAAHTRRPIAYDVDGRRDINRLAVVGTPHRGSPKPYYMWEGGDPVLADSVGDWVDRLLSIYARVTRDQYEHLVRPLERKCFLSACVPVDASASEYKRFYRDHVPTIGQLLTPAEDRYLLSSNRSVVPPGNALLEALNGSSAALLSRLGGRVATFVGTSDDDNTPTWIDVGNPAGLYAAGAPLSGGGARKSHGDATVPTASASWLATVGVGRQPVESPGTHVSLIDTFKGDVCSFLTNASCVGTATLAAASGPASRRLVVAVRGRAQPYLVDPSARGTGVTPSTGSAEQGIPDSEVTLHPGGGGISLGGPADGDYMLQLATAHDEDYRLTISYGDASTTETKDIRIFGRAGETRTLTLTVASTATEKVVVAQDPSLVTGLLASPFAGAGGLTTVLRWSAVPAAASYNVYVKPDGGPFFSLLKSVVTTSTDAQVPWAVAEGSTRRVFAVTAVKPDGTESFLGDIVSNDDRDADGAADWLEVENGTNPDDGDSDDDGLSDGQEAALGTDPLAGDTDSDGFGDSIERRRGSDPLDAGSLPVVTADLDRDGHTDIVWRHTGGALYVWQMNGTALKASSYLPPIGLAWTIQGIGDFNGDGKSDLLWRETASGSTYLWLMDGATAIGAGYTGAQTDNTWTIQGVGDFDADGKSDILWRHTGGALYVWQMDGTTVKASSYLPPISLAWQIEALGDFDGDGRTDILWRDTAGSTYVWFMDGATKIGAGYTAAQTDNSWTIQGVGDFDADGQSDILWRHTGGALYVWQLNGTATKAASYLPPISLAWQIQQLGDFDGDGRTDILWRESASGSTYEWLMDGAVTVGAGYTAAQADTTWVIQAP